MDPGARVCPFCGRPPGTGVFCQACGRNLAAVERLPTRAEWEADGAGAGADAGLAERCREATDSFLVAMHGAGDPGAEKLQMAGHGRFGRALHARGWVLRAARHDDPEEDPTRFEPGLFLSVQGEFHRLDSQVRGWGQRTFPTFHPVVAAEPAAPPADARVPDELAALLHAHGVAPGPAGPS